MGFWIRGDDGGYRMDAQRSQAIARALGNVDDEWLRFYRDNVLAGDGRFVVVAGKVAADQLQLTLRNTGKKVATRIAGRLDLSALER